MVELMLQKSPLPSQRQQFIRISQPARLIKSALGTRIPFFVVCCSEQAYSGRRSFKLHFDIKRREIDKRSIFLSLWFFNELGAVLGESKTFLKMRPREGGRGRGAICVRMGDI